MIKSKFTKFSGYSFLVLIILLVCTLFLETISIALASPFYFCSIILYCIGFIWIGNIKLVNSTKLSPLPRLSILISMLLIFIFISIVIGVNLKFALGMKI